MLPGYVLVGGKSTRMRRDKALLPWYQQPLFAHLRDVLIPQCSQVTLLGSERGEFGTCRVLPDAYPEMGPLGGILSALKDPGENWRLVISCDTPLVSGELVSELIAEGGVGAAERADVVLPETPDGRLQPLCALWNPRIAARLESHLGRLASAPGFPRSELSVQRFIRSLSYRKFSPRNPGELQNVNTMRDYLALLGGHGSPS
ncbi:MAG: molybdenum cofactor guanylyltransferase [Bryobacterales bacterium]|nr:molybdenum cofactor guanylyltransferase [Bryobacterales bacterium]